MNALDAHFELKITDRGNTRSLKQGEHFRVYPIGQNADFGRELTARQVDLIRIATAVHVADGWVRRSARRNGARSPILEVQVLAPGFWESPETRTLLEDCVNFLSGNDQWSFRFVRLAQGDFHERQARLLRGPRSACIALYSGGLDSAAGLASRLAAEPARVVVPVTVQYSMQKATLFDDHFEMLIGRGLTTRHLLLPFQIAAFVRSKRIKREFGAKPRETTHRCRPLPFMTIAGLVAHSFAAPEVEVYESGVGSINLPLVGGPADYRTTRSTHPHFLRLVSALVSHVNDDKVDYVLPFAHQTKAEMVARLRELGLEELARRSISCILHPLRRLGWQQCGYCPACVFRRQAMITAGIVEEQGAYAIDLFTSPDPFRIIPARELRCIRAFNQQIASLAVLDAGSIPTWMRRYLYATHAVSSDEQMQSHAEVHRRYRREWRPLIDDGSRRCLPWAVTARPLALAQGTT